MPPFGLYDSLWSLIALVILLPGVFIAVCRSALHRFSRKALLSEIPTATQQQLEESLSRKDEYQESLEVVDFALRFLVVLCLACGRFVALEAPHPGEESTKLLVDSQLLQVFHLGLELLIVLSVFFGLIPSVVARVWAELWLRRFLPTISSISRLTTPVRVLGNRLSRMGAVLLGGEKERTSADIVEEEILSAVEEGEREGLIHSRDIDMIESIMSYGGVEVSEVMTPRTEMVTLDLERPLEENLQRVIECGHSRIPVCRGSKDNIVGVLYVKDLQKYWLRKEEIDLEAIVREPHFVSPKAKISGLLGEFKGHRHHLAIVRDEHGGTEGLITIEDILEEIVGEISDEYEEEETLIKSVTPHLVEVDASVHIDDLNKRLGSAIPEGETYDTVGGYLFESMGKVPAVGDTYEWNGLRLEVIDADDRRVHRLRLHLPEKPAAESSAAGKILREESEVRKSAP